MKEKAAKQEQHQPSKQNGKVDEFGIPLPSNDSYRYVLAYMRCVYSTCVPYHVHIIMYTLYYDHTSHSDSTAIVFIG